MDLLICIISLSTAIHMVVLITFPNFQLVKSPNLFPVNPRPTKTTPTTTPSDKCKLINETDGRFKLPTTSGDCKHRAVGQSLGSTEEPTRAPNRCLINKCAKTPNTEEGSAKEKRFEEGRTEGSFEKGKSPAKEHLLKSSVRNLGVKQFIKNSSICSLVPFVSE